MANVARSHGGDCGGDPPEGVHWRPPVVQPKNVPTQSMGSKVIKYQPLQQSAAFHSGAKERIVARVEMPVDPLELPKFKHKRVPKASGSLRMPILHTPSRRLIVQNQKDWKISDV